MASLVVQLDDEAVERLSRRALRQGIEVTDLASQLLRDASEQDPFEFVGSFSSDVLGAHDVDRFLDEHSFGSQRS